MSFKLPLLVCSLALLPHVLPAGSGPELVKVATSKSMPETCSSIVPAWNFGPNDAAVHVFFLLNNVAVGTRIRLDLYQDVDGNFGTDKAELSQQANWDPETEGGNFCYVADLNIKGEAFSNLQGEWTVKVLYDSGNGFTALTGPTGSFNIAPNASSSDLLLSIPDVNAADAPKIKINALVRDTTGKALADLNASNFTLTDNDRKQDITVRPLDDTDRLSIALVVDSSAAMTGKGDQYADEKSAAKRFLDSLRSTDEVSVYAMGGTVTRVQDSTTDRSQAAAAIDNLPEGKATPLYKAVSDASSYLAGKKGRKAIVMLTNGSNQSEEPPAFDDAVKAANAAGVPVAAVGFGEAKHHILEMMSLQTNGFYNSSEQSTGLPDVLAQVAKTLAAGQELTFTTTETRISHSIALTAQLDDKRSEPVMRNVTTAASGSNGPRQGTMVFEKVGTSQFVAMDLPGGKITQLGVRGYTPALSPDARKLAYRDSKDRLHIRWLESGEDRELTSDRNYRFSPTFAGNDTLAYLRDDGNGINICLTPVDKFSERVWPGTLPLSLKKWMQIEWVPGTGTDAASFVLVADDIHLLSGKTPKILVPVQKNVTYRYPSVSPDGKRLAYVVDTSFSDIYVTDLSGGTPIRATATKDASWPAWSPDGNYLAFLSTSAVDRGKSESGSIGTFLFRIAIMDSKGEIVEVLKDSDGQYITVPGDQVSWK